MQDLIITICRDTRNVKTSRNFLGVCCENGQGNIIIDFTDKEEFIDGTCKFFYGKNSVSTTKNATQKTYSTPITSAMLSNAGQVVCQIKIEGTSSSSGKPVFKSELFKLSCLDAVDV